ncbi:hypothetical protein H696_01340 [Fonticula alba]|uniref:Uncharacterized protein n=1 Tax=Fonticula alba TaxID=691883 RepID=A0A058ZDB8_FONAL|nr:hypothetical protein H696_01340 [Fonticula alba]KCV71931.1 hypothetical protein H696_01340 [Fonticula alba]|eukprot:XP_009493509.1 hypothetical protein H696_01340 [Fonticula alba]
MTGPTGAPLFVKSESLTLYSLGVVIARAEEKEYYKEILDRLKKDDKNRPKLIELYKMSHNFDPIRRANVLAMVHIFLKDDKDLVNRFLGYKLAVVDFVQDMLSILEKGVRPFEMQAIYFALYTVAPFLDTTHYTVKHLPQPAQATAGTSGSGKPLNTWPKEIYLPDEAGLLRCVNNLKTDPTTSWSMGVWSEGPKIEDVEDKLVSLILTKERCGVTFRKTEEGDSLFCHGLRNVKYLAEHHFLYPSRPKVLPKVRDISDECARKDFDKIIQQRYVASLELVKAAEEEMVAYARVAIVNIPSDKIEAYEKVQALQEASLFEFNFKSTDSKNASDCMTKLLASRRYNESFSKLVIFNQDDLIDGLRKQLSILENRCSTDKIVDIGLKPNNEPEGKNPPPGRHNLRKLVDDNFRMDLANENLHESKLLCEDDWDVAQGSIERIMAILYLYLLPPNPPNPPPSSSSSSETAILCDKCKTEAKTTSTSDQSIAT